MLTLETGRRYHVYYGEDKNLHPIDEIEQDRCEPPAMSEDLPL
jgi:hypothetical protein